MKSYYTSILIILAILSLAFSQSAWQKEARQRHINQIYKITSVNDHVLKLTHKQYGQTRFVDISDRGFSVNKLADDMQVFDLMNIPDSIYSNKYICKDTILVAGAMGFPIVIGDFNKNGKLDFFGDFENKVNYDLSKMAIVELQEDSSFIVKKIYPDSIVFPYAVTDLDKDGLLELNAGYVGTQWPEIHNYESQSDTLYPDTLNFAYKEYQSCGQVSSETFTDLDQDGITDVIHVGDDTLPPDGYKVYVAEYKKDLNNFVQVFRFPPPKNFNVYGFSVGDFDGDGYLEFTTGSIDGDVYIFENTGDDSYKCVFQDTISTPNAYLTCATNDIDNNGKIEFFIGGSSYYNGIGGTKVYWFEADGNDHYKKVRTFFLTGTDVLGMSTLYSYDVNWDGKDDLVFTYEDVIIILEWTNGKFKIFYLTRLNDWHKDFQSVNIYNMYGSEKPDLFISLNDYYNQPAIFSLHYVYNYLSNIKYNTKALPKFILNQNYPNPFNSTTTIRFEIKTKGLISLVIYDITGKEVIKLIKNQKLNPGEHNISWNGSNKMGKEVSSGIYLYQLKTKNFTATRKLLFIK